MRAGAAERGRRMHCGIRAEHERVRRAGKIWVGNARIALIGRRGIQELSRTTIEPSAPSLIDAK